MIIYDFNKIRSGICVFWGLTKRPNKAYKRLLRWLIDRNSIWGDL